ncbi:hypothetical protein MGG_17763 [Pyricularia oryzae 70-15]|uniref:Uncharacterized protein n=3 Tax=Pyricularia oryzae TaxID=318829 RepID=G4NHP9_PYRO7|nr:uncharacterized protein MGG_17763 [Pyricularia oryzae 70-15]EHA47759.1 hypothetical protein MGG_17763 [Pyricularia oryzae 70-15]ELQ44315.1 hypothetical protein OOU_Y34scaffold00092g8 [Pyricularia oryzae Y34]
MFNFSVPRMVNFDDLRKRGLRSGGANLKLKHVTTRLQQRLSALEVLQSHARCKPCT